MDSNPANQMTFGVTVLQKKVCRRLFISLLLFIAPVSCIAQAACSTVNCDCDTLNEANLATECRQQEETMTQSCRENGGVISQFCTWHGPQATQVALTLRPDNLQSLDSWSNTVLLDRFQAIHTSIKDDIALTRNADIQTHFGSISDLLKAVRLNIDNLLSIQQTLADRPPAKGTPTQSWRDYGIRIDALYQIFSAYENELWIQFKQTKDQKWRKAYRILYARMTLASGAALENIAFAAEHTSPKNAARAWEIAAQHGEEALDRLAEQSAHKTHQYLRSQTIHRFFRAAWQAQLARKQRHAKILARKAYSLLDNGSPNTQLATSLREATEQQNAQTDTDALDNSDLTSASAREDPTTGTANSLQRARAWLRGSGSAARSAEDNPEAELTTTPAQDGAEKWNLPGRRYGSN